MKRVTHIGRVVSVISAILFFAAGFLVVVAPPAAASLDPTFTIATGEGTYHSGTPHGSSGDVTVKLSPGPFQLGVADVTINETGEIYWGQLATYRETCLFRFAFGVVSRDSGDAGNLGKVVSFVCISLRLFVSATPPLGFHQFPTALPSLRVHTITLDDVSDTVTIDGSIEAVGSVTIK